MTIHVSEAKLADGFGASAFHSVLPLVIWAAHFFVSYGSAEVACALHLYRFTVFGVSAPNAWLWLISAVAIATLFVLTVRAVRQRSAHAKPVNTQAAVRIGAAVLALVGVLWSVVQIAFLYGPTICSATH